MLLKSLDTRRPDGGCAEEDVLGQRMLLPFITILVIDNICVMCKNVVIRFLKHERKVIFMKKMWLCVFAAMLCMMVIVPDIALAYTDATKKITIYTQLYNGGNEHSKLPLSGSTMGRAGCLIFAYGHAIQWLKNINIPGTELLQPMTKEGGTPWLYSNCNYYASKDTCLKYGINLISCHVAGTVPIHSIPESFISTVGSRPLVTAS